MKNPIPHSGLFVTPQSVDELSQALNSIGSPEEQRLAWIGAQMALNLAHKLVEEQNV